jgi:hypothetical protein
MTGIRFQPGVIVHAADQDNYGDVIEDNGGPKVHVHFTEVLNFSTPPFLKKVVG